MSSSALFRCARSTVEPIARVVRRALVLVIAALVRGARSSAEPIARVVRPAPVLVIVALIPFAVVGVGRGYADTLLPGEAVPTPRPTPVDRPDPCEVLILGRVVDTASGAPVPEVRIRLEAGGDSGESVLKATETDARGRFSLRRLCSGQFTLHAEHVAYESWTSSLSVARQTDGGAEVADTLRVLVSLEPKVFRMDEVDVRAETVTPLSGLERASQSLPPAAIEAFISGDLIDAIALVPGVLVSDDRPYFRGLGQEHVTPTIDGVLAREPITGSWVLPPPQAIDGAEVIASAMIAESTPSLGGLFAMRLAAGSDRPHTRIVYGRDRLGSVPAGARDTDTITLSSSGPTGIGGLTFSGGYRGSATNGSLSFDRSLPEQSFLGGLEPGGRMSGEEAVSLKFTWRPGTRTARPPRPAPTSTAAPGDERSDVPAPALAASPWEVSAAVVATRSRKKVYSEHYARSGWVGYLEEFDRYTDFIEGAPVPGRDVYYEGPAHVPVEDARSTLLLASASRIFGAHLSADARVSYGDHMFETNPPGPRFSNEDDLVSWWRESITRSNHQESEFYVVHGDLPDFSRSRSREGGVTLTSRLRIADQHSLRIGLAATAGRYRYVTVAAAPIYYFGSFEEPVDAVETSAYLEETWFSDDRSWMRVSLRHLSRKTAYLESRSRASRWAPVLAFHQPMTAADALNVEVGQSYQFSTLVTQFAPSTVDELPPQIVQRVRFVEIGFQHHFSRKVVGYLGVDDREYADVVFGTQTPAAYEELTGERTTPSGGLETRQIQLAVDYQVNPRLLGQSSLVWSKTTADALAGQSIEVPWSRRALVQTWLTWRGVRGFSTTITGSWNSGRPYDICLLARDCASWQRIRGTLPSVLGLDFAGGWRRTLGSYGIEASVQVRNLLGIRKPDYSFSVYPMAVTSNNFLAYWDETGETDGYLIDSGNGQRLTRLDNPETRMAGRSVLVAIGLSF